MDKRAKKVADVLKKDIWFHIFSTTSIFLIITSFFLPPQGVIDPSVALAVGEIFAFGGLGAVYKAIDKGLDAKVEHNNTSITIGDLNMVDDNGIDRT